MTADEKVVLIERLEADDEVEEMEKPSKKDKKHNLKNPLWVYKNLVKFGNCFISYKIYKKLDLYEFEKYNIRFTKKIFENGFVLEIEG